MIAHPRLFAAAIVACSALLSVHAAEKEVIPPPPPRHFNDIAGVVPTVTEAQLDSQLAQFERETSNQIVVAVYRTMESPSSIDDYAVRVFEAWRVGGKARDNGALLLVFTESRKMRIQTGYGLEGALPDALAKQIIENEIAPRFREGDYAGGLTAGVQAMIAATRGEYKGSGRTVAETRGSRGSGSLLPLLFFALILFLMFGRGRRRRSVVYGRRGRSVMGAPWWGGPGGWGGGGFGGGGGGGFGGGGGGGFSGGGGSTGGGGASGSW